MRLEDLPRIDEHAVTVAATPEATWEATLEVLGRSLPGGLMRRCARMLGCESTSTSGWTEPSVGSTIPGFRIVTADKPDLLVLSGRHRFSRYGLAFRIEAVPTGAHCRAETRALFPGVRGNLYRLAVIGTRGHVVLVRRLLRAIQRAAERAARA